MRVFVDSGVYIDYLQGNGVRIHVLKTFGDLLDQGKFKLIFPNITKEEIYKGVPLDHGRYSKNQFDKSLMPAVPAGVEESEKYEQAQELLNKYNEKLEEVRKESLNAVDDILQNHIGKLMENAENIQEDPSVLEGAQVRKLKNNPPGKSIDPLCDEIIWELLLQKCTDENLAIIVHDGDWKYIDGNKTQLHPFLQKEWDDKNTGNKIELFSSLAPWQPVTVVGGSEMVQCYSCGKWVNRKDYYGFTPKGYACKFCEET